MFVPAGEDIAFAANGRTDLIVAAIDTAQIEHWMQARRGTDGIDPQKLLQPSAVTGQELTQRTQLLTHTLSVLMDQGHDATEESQKWSIAVLVSTRTM